MLLEVSDLHVAFQVKKRWLPVLHGVSLTLGTAQVHGLVGESGCGKTVTALSVLRLLPRNGHVLRGRIRWQGTDLLGLTTEEMRQVRGRRISMIFQNPQMALNPLYSIEQQIVDVIRLHHRVSRAAARDEAIKLLENLGFPDPRQRIKAYPHELSGGMCQRALIAMALACRPNLLIADEPTAALDVTIQAQILDLLLEIRERYAMSILLISHDLGVIAKTCDYVTVMYLGKIMESAPAERLFAYPKHPYTQALLRAVPVPDPSQRGGFALPLRSDVSNHGSFVEGCPFHPRCPLAMELCRKEAPPLECDDNGTTSACWVARRE